MEFLDQIYLWLTIAPIIEGSNPYSVIRYQFINLCDQNSPLSKSFIIPKTAVIAINSLIIYLINIHDVNSIIEDVADAEMKVIAQGDVFSPPLNRVYSEVHQ